MIACSLHNVIYFAINLVLPLGVKKVRLVFTSVGDGVVIRSVGLYDLVKKATVSLTIK